MHLDIHKAKSILDVNGGKDEEKKKKKTGKYFKK